MNGTAVSEFLKALAGVVALVGIPLTIVTYRRSVRTKRAEWLVSLHEKFFEQDRFVGLFDYDLRLLTKHQFIVQVLEPQGFERRGELLRATRLLPSG
jgi:hypothetical protein